MAFLKGLIRGASAAALGYGQGKLKRQAREEERADKQQATEFATRKFMADENERRRDRDAAAADRASTDSYRNAQLSLAQARLAAQSARTPEEIREAEIRLKLLEAQLEGTTARNSRIGQPTPRVNTPDDDREAAAYQYRDRLVEQGLPEAEANSRAQQRFPTVNFGRPNELMELMKMFTGGGVGGAPARAGGTPARTGGPPPR